MSAYLWTRTHGYCGARRVKRASVQPRQSSPAAPFTLCLYPGTKQLCVTHGSNFNLGHLLMAPPPHPLPPSLKQLTSAPFLFEAFETLIVQLPVFKMSFKYFSKLFLPFQLQ